MFDKKEMKLINFEKAKKYLMNGVHVYMVNLDGSLVEINEDTDWKSIIFHNLKGGSYAVYKKKLPVLVHLLRISISVSGILL